MAGLDFDFRGQPDPHVHEFQCEECGEPTSSFRPEETLCPECVRTYDAPLDAPLDVPPTVIASKRTAAVDEDAEWQRVNSYIADVLKDCYVLFAKLARLRGDFAGAELAKLDGISSKVRDMGQELASFSKAFTEGEYSMHKKEQYGGPDMEVPADFEPTAEDFDFSPEGEGGGEPAPEEFEVPEEGQGELEFEEEEPEEEEPKKSEKSEEKE